jgi:hypothetical protein
MDYFKGMQYVDGPVCSRAHVEGKISDLGVAKKRLGLDFTKGLKLLAALPLARWKMRSRFRLNGKVASLVSAVTVHGHSGKTEVADYSWSG